MFDGRQILACSLLSQDDDVYLSGIVGAARKKQGSKKIAFYW